MVEFSEVYKLFFFRLGPVLIPTRRNLIYVEFLEIKGVRKPSKTARLTNECTAADITNTALIYKSAAVKLLCVMIFVGGWKAGRMERRWH